MRSLSVALALVLAAAWPAAAPAQVTLFFDDFNGPPLSPSFQAVLPSDPQVGSYVGPSNYTFGTVDGASIIRLSNTLNNTQRVGWSTSASVQVTDFRYEMRFNTLVQSPASGFDFLIEGWLIDAANQNRYDVASPYAQIFGTDRRFLTRSSIDNDQVNSESFGFQNNTWYRLVVQGRAGQNIRGSVFGDDGTTELIGLTFGHVGAAFPSGFRLGLSQSMGIPGMPSPTDVAIDWMRLTVTPVPEPSALLLAGAAAAGAWAARRSRKRL
jgi:hypothetical protein